MCMLPGGGGSINRCDFNRTTCPTGETCQGGGGCPKYGDYNGIACAGGYVIAGWTSATSPAGLPSATGMRVFSSMLFVARNGAATWRYTGTPCSGDSCPGWQRLDNNSKTVAISAAGGKLYQLHSDGWIWRYTGTPCSGDSLPGWQRLDNNSKTIAISAAGNNLYQLHNDGWIWRYTGTPCVATTVPAGNGSTTIRRRLRSQLLVTISTNFTTTAGSGATPARRVVVTVVPGGNGSTTIQRRLDFTCW